MWSSTASPLFLSILWTCPDQCLESGHRIRSPEHPEGPWIPLVLPAMPDYPRQHRLPKEPRPHPIYAEYEDGTITVRQLFLPGEHSATRQEMEDCDARIVRRPDSTEISRRPRRVDKPRARRNLYQLSTARNSNALMKRRRPGLVFLPFSKQ